MKQLALQALDWSSRVSLEGDEAVSVEIGGSLRLFGGAAGIVQSLPPRASWAIAPTPRAALWLMRGAPGTSVYSREQLAGALGSLPLSVLALPARLHERLHGFGLRHVVGLMRLPRQDLARRVGQPLLDDLRRALGEVPDPKVAWKPLPRYAGQRALEYESVSGAVLLHATDFLLGELTRILRVSGRGVRRCTVVLLHREGVPTRIRIGLLEAVQEPDRLREQLETLLDRTPLPAPVVSVALHATRMESINGSARDLFAPRASGEGWTVLLERLRVRLGDTALFQICPHADHRPERAFRAFPPWAREVVPGMDGVSQVHHPLWLLPSPQPVLDTSSYRVERGPERIEYGWWDGGDVRRDYFVLRDGRGARHWVFQERRAPYGWYRHGLFG